MIKRCVECKTEKDYPKYFEFCPVCGGKLEKLTMKEYIMTMYDKGTAVRTIAGNIRKNPLFVCDIINRELAKTNTVPNYIQTEYIDQIRPFVSDNDWDGKLKPIMEQLPEDCTYDTIAYVADMVRREGRLSHEEMVNCVDNAIREGKSPEEIMEASGANTYIVEREIVRMIREEGVNATPYIQAEYADDIVTKATAGDWDRKLRTLKDGMPEDCSYLTIKAVLAANAL